MSADQPTEKLFEDDPVLGAYRSHHPSARERLLLQAGLIYAVASILLQFLFADLDDTAASIVLIGAFALLALALGWYVLHLWNREVVLYERGFTYREGSRIAAFRYEQIRSVHLKAERIVYFGLFPRDLYTYRLITDQEEVLRINNLYKRVAELGRRMEQAIARAQYPAAVTALNNGEAVGFGPELSLTADGVQSGERHIPWEQITGHRAADDHLIIEQQTGEPLRVPLDDIHNLMLLVDLLHERRAEARDAKATAATITTSAQALPASSEETERKPGDAV